MATFKISAESVCREGRRWVSVWFLRAHGFDSAYHKALRHLRLLDLDDDRISVRKVNVGEGVDVMVGNKGRIPMVETLPGNSIGADRLAILNGEWQSYSDLTTSEVNWVLNNNDA